LNFRFVICNLTQFLNFSDRKDRKDHKDSFQHCDTDVLSNESQMKHPTKNRQKQTKQTTKIKDKDKDNGQRGKESNVG